MSELESTFERFKEELGRFLLKIQTDRILDPESFERLEADSRRLAEQLRHQSLVPKSILRELRMAVKTLDAEAPYMHGNKDAMIDMAGKLEMTFDLILLGEDYGDRLPGISRDI